MGGWGTWTGQAVYLAAHAGRGLQESGGGAEEETGHDESWTVQISVARPSLALLDWRLVGPSLAATLHQTTGLGCVGACLDPATATHDACRGDLGARNRLSWTVSGCGRRDGDLESLEARGGEGVRGNGPGDGVESDGTAGSGGHRGAQDCVSDRDGEAGDRVAMGRSSGVEAAAAATQEARREVQQEAWRRRTSLCDDASGLARALALALAHAHAPLRILTTDSQQQRRARRVFVKSSCRGHSRPDGGAGCLGDSCCHLAMQRCFGADGVQGCPSRARFDI